jgi:hypothetical protein
MLKAKMRLPELRAVQEDGEALEDKKKEVGKEEKKGNCKTN